MPHLTESIVEDAALEWFGELGYSCLGPEALTPTLSHGERESYGEVVLVGRLRAALRQINPTIPEEAREEALRKVLRLDFPSLVSAHRYQSRTLATPGDTLQPELPSGELNAADLESKLEAAA